MEKNKITVRQAFIIFFISTLSPAIRLFPAECSRLAKQACWLAPMISAIALYLVCIVLNILFQNKNVTSLSDIFFLSLGKVVGRIVLSFYLFWCFILFSLYIRYYADRLLTSIFTDANIHFFILTMMVIVYIAARGKIETFARFAELLFLVFIVVFIVIFLLLIPNVEISNLFPITYHDIIPASKASYRVLGAWGYITLLFFLGENIMNKDQIKKQSKSSILLLTIMTTLMLIFVVGSLGYSVAERMPLPFFNVTKLISLVETLDRLESVLLSVWVVSDFIIITLFAMIIMKITKSLFSVSETKFFASPLVLLGFIGSQFLFSNRFESELFSNVIAIKVNIIICFILPVIILAIGKLRKTI